MRRYERASTLLTSNRPSERLGKLLGGVESLIGTCVVTALTRLGREAYATSCPGSWTATAALESIIVLCETLSAVS
jgi:hypothetical protein